jgi:hypothetical protein
LGILKIALRLISSELKIVSMMAMLLGGSAAIAADYSVGVVGLGVGTGFGYSGTAVNLYRTTAKGVELVQNYISPEIDWTGQFSRPLTLAVNPTHDFVYIAYTGTPLPNIVGFKITPLGLVKEWGQELDTGDPSLQGTTLVALDGYLVENTYPGVGLWVNILTQSGQEVVFDAGSNGDDLVSGHIDPTGKFYYSCRDVSSSPTVPAAPANTVLVFNLDRSATTPLLTSIDPTFVQGICTF